MARAHAQGHIEIVSAGIDALNRRDVDALAAMCSAAVEILLPGALGEPVAYNGRDAIAAYVRDQDEHWSAMRVEVDAIHALDSRVLVIGVQTARGRVSGIAVRTHLAMLVTVEDGRIAAVHGFRGPAEAV